LFCSCLLRSIELVLFIWWWVQSKNQLRSSFMSACVAKLVLFNDEFSQEINQEIDLHLQRVAELLLFNDEFSKKINCCLHVYYTYVAELLLSIIKLQKLTQLESESFFLFSLSACSLWLWHCLDVVYMLNYMYLDQSRCFISSH